MKPATPRSDALRAQREARYGHLQATAEPAKMGRPVEPKPSRKLIPYAGKDTGKAISQDKIGRNPGRKRIKRKENR